MKQKLVLLRIIQPVLQVDDERVRIDLRRRANYLNLPLLFAVGDGAARRRIYVHVAAHGIGRPAFRSCLVYAVLIGVEKPRRGKSRDFLFQMVGQHSGLKACSAFLRHLVPFRESIRVRREDTRSVFLLIRYNSR